MISKLLFALENGWTRVQANTKLLLVVLVLFVFPLLFVVVLEEFYDVATSNIQTVEQQRLYAVHTLVESVITSVSTDNLSPILQSVGENTDNLTSLRVYEVLETDLLLVTASANPNEVGATTTNSGLLQLGNGNPHETFTVPLVSASGRISQSVRYVPTELGNYYIFSEYSHKNIDTVMSQRKQGAYIVLSLIFAFLIGLAYWIARQSDWEKRYLKLHATLQERDLFSNMIAHEFRTPLTAIKGYASFLQESKTMSPEEVRFADTIRESAERLVLLVNDFLEIARIQSGKLKIESKISDVRTPIQTVVDSLSEEAKSHGLQLVYTPELKPQLLNTDTNRFVQILTNIVSNSIKYTESGTVEVSCDATRSGLTIRVKDTGMGISAEDQKKLFSPFARVGGVEKTATTGTGLGMWITKQMIELLHGTIEVESIKGVGTHVVMKFEHTGT